MKIKPEAWLILVALTLIWGSSFILIKRGLEGFTPMQVGSLRICFAGLILLPVSLGNIHKVSGRTVFYSFLFGLMNAGVPAFLFAYAETEVDSSTAGILNALTPIFTLLVGVTLFRVSFNTFKLIGVAIGFVGATMLAFFSHGFDKPLQVHDSQFTFTLLIVLATFMYGFSGNIMKRYLDNVSGPVISSYAYGTFAVPSAIYLAFSDFGHRLNTNPKALPSLGYLSILGIFGSAVAIILFSRLLKQSNALFGSFVTYLLPFVAILWGITDGETVGIVPFISLGIILTGIYVSGWKPKKQIAPVQTETVTQAITNKANS